jgi:Spy/CpxP family protein refolding chaperone
MTSRILALVVLALSLLAAVGAQGAEPQSGAADPRPGQLVDSLFAPFTDQLNLTPEQRAQIEAIAAPEYARGEALLLRLNRVTAELDEEQSKETFDEDKVRALASQAGQAMAEMTVIKLRVKARVTALLTPGQKSLVEEQLRLNRERDGGLSLY